ncbi:MAG: hypothetical protein N2513_04740 [Deltaproteobacteria bacterium]|nr:hypothetical protein [Deltaproteobacteria bacterium]
MIAILAEAWFEKILDTYHPETKSFYMDEKNIFLNPIGATYRENINTILLAIVSEEFYSEKVHLALENMIKIGCLHGYSCFDGKSYTELLEKVLEERQIQVSEGIAHKIKEAMKELSIYEQDVYSKVAERLKNLKTKEKTFKRSFTLRVYRKYIDD